MGKEQTSLDLGAHPMRPCRAIDLDGTPCTTLVPVGRQICDCCIEVLHEQMVRVARERKTTPPSPGA